MVFPINPSFPQVCSAPGSTALSPPGLHRCHLPLTPAALCGTHTSLPCPFPSGSQSQGNSMFSQPVPQASWPHSQFCSPIPQATHQGGNKQTSRGPFLHAAAEGQPSPPSSTPQFVLFELLKPNMAQHVSVFSFIMSELAHGPSLLGSASSQLLHPTH